MWTVSDTYRYAQLLFVQYWIDPIASNFRKRFRKTPSVIYSSEPIRSAHVCATFFGFDGFSVVQGPTKFMMSSATAGDSTQLNNKGETRHRRFSLIKPWSYQLSHVLQLEILYDKLINYVNYKRCGVWLPLCINRWRISGKMNLGWFSRFIFIHISQSFASGGPNVGSGLRNPTGGPPDTSCIPPVIPRGPQGAVISPSG